MSALSRVLALAQPYSRTEHGHLEHVRGYAGRKLADLANGARDSSAYQNYEITDHVVDLRNDLDPEMVDRLLHHRGTLTHDQAEDIIRQLIDYKKRIGWQRPVPAVHPTPHKHL